MSADLIELWHQRARPNPTESDFNVQLGCHFEEIAEMLDCIEFTTDGMECMEGAHTIMSMMASYLKRGEVQARIVNRKELLDSIGDQIVTAIGVGHCAQMNVTEAVRRVNASNWSKFDIDGKPIFNDEGKITKGPRYAPPDLEGLY